MSEPTPPRDDDRAERGEAAAPPPTTAAAAAAAPDPRSPRPVNVTLGGTTPTVPPPFPPVFVDRVPQQRSSMSSMMMMMMMFFFMSGGNAPQQHIIIGEDGEIRPRVSELDVMRKTVDEYRGYLNGTGTNWTEPAVPDLLASAIVPTRYDHSLSAALGAPFFPNITGWYRRAHVSMVDLNATTPTSSFFTGVDIPSVNTPEWNETYAAELRGDYNWSSVTVLDMNLRERWITPLTNETKEAIDAGDDPLASPITPDAWAWVTGAVTLGGEREINYDIVGLHHIPNGTYELFGMPEGVRIDLRNIPRLYPTHHNETHSIILAELEHKLRLEENSFLFTDAKIDDPVVTHCPLLMHFALPPLPAGVSLEDVMAYDAELANPTGILTSLTRPPRYWDHAFGGVIVADQCGWAMGVEGGKGVRRDDYWRQSINYAAYATLSQFIVLILLVRQMEATRTPSTLAKVSLWMVVLLGVSDAWIFSAHLAVGVMSNNKTSLPMIVPGFCALCTAIVFAPRYAVLLHRIQAPERAGISDPETEDGAQLPFTDRVANVLSAYPGLKWLGGVFFLFVFFQVLTPTLVPFIFFGMHSIWAPQIWRNARRGSANGLSHTFILGISMARLALPLYGLACPENVFFFEAADWVWGLVVWEGIQVSILFAQDRFGPGFFLPKRFAPSEGYDYHPVLQAPSDPEAGGHGFEGGTTCSICMEDVHVFREPADADPAGPSALLAMNARRAYAVAPCHHLFHTKCLQQWITIKTICPLCKRPLPPL